CGECPFDGTFTEIASQHMLVPPPSLREKVPTLSEEVEQVVLRALSKDPAQRFIDIEAFAGTLAEAITGKSAVSVMLHPPTPLHAGLAEEETPSLSASSPIPSAIEQEIEAPPDTTFKKLVTRHTIHVAIEQEVEIPKDTPHQQKDTEEL